MGVRGGVYRSAMKPVPGVPRRPHRRVIVAAIAGIGFGVFAALDFSLNGAFAAVGVVVGAAVAVWLVGR